MRRIPHGPGMQAESLPIGELSRRRGQAKRSDIYFARWFSVTTAQESN